MEIEDMSVESIENFLEKKKVKPDYYIECRTCMNSKLEITKSVAKFIMSHDDSFDVHALTRTKAFMRKF